ncbi:Lin0512 family protein [Alphaproteobacteria bacterium]|nr:Lin0512 family protein [Alphaproteobacteria bacterium]
MAKKRMVIELGMGSSLRQQDYTRAACRAVEDALWHNSLSIADAFGLDRSAMIIEVEIGVQQPAKVNTEKVAAILPYGQGSVRAVYGGLDVPKPNGGVTVIANAAVVVYLNLEPAGAA